MKSEPGEKDGPIAVFELPEDRREWAKWLEKQIVGLDLLRVVRQLVAMGGNHPPKRSLSDVLGNQREAILSKGLSGTVDTNQLQELIRNPFLLLELQNAVLLHGGEAWTIVPRSAAHQASAEATSRAVLDRIQRESIGVSQNRVNTDSDDENHRSTDEPSFSPKVSLPTTVSGGKGLSTRSGWLTALAGLAAMLLLGFFLLPSRPSNQLFFAASDLKVKLAKPEQNLERMAKRIRSDWKTGLTSSALKIQLVSFRDSCDQLITGPLVPTLDGLPPPVITDVQDRCRQWKKQMTDLIAQLDSGQSPDQIQRNADALIEKLTKKLEEIARSS